MRDRILNILVDIDYFLHNYNQTINSVVIVIISLCLIITNIRLYQVQQRLNILESTKSSSNVELHLLEK